jgi:hypothetical protein
MKHLKKFENFHLSPDVDSDEQEFLDYSRKMREMNPKFRQEEEEVMPEDLYARDEEEGDFNMEDDFDSMGEEEGDFNPMDDDFEDNYEDNYDSEDHLDHFNDMEDDFDTMGEEEEEEEDYNDGGHIMRFEAKSNSYKKKGSKPDFLDLDKDGDKKESMKKAAKDAKEGKKDGKKGLTAAQKKLPEGLRKAIEARKKK